MRIRQPVVRLNENQKKIVEWNEGAILVSAGPGSGKTLTVVLRIINMINNYGVKPESILATTFTRKAADEMNARLRGRGINTNRMSVQTMHSYCFHLLRNHKTYRHWTVDEKDIARIVLKNILGYKQMNWRDADLIRVEQYISLMRSELVPPERAIGQVLPAFADPRYSQAYAMYDDEMCSRRLITFDDMLYYGVRLLELDTTVLDRERGKYHYVIIDEFQDSNVAQIRLGEIIAAPMYNYMAVGDVDQAIYSWRGAVPEFMIDFADKYSASVIELGVNYRCAPIIVDSARNCIEHNERRLPKELIASRDIDTTIRFEQPTNIDEEARVVRKHIQSYIEDGFNLGQIAILMRMNSQSRALEEELIEHKIPFVVLGAVSFYERKEIRDLISYLRLIEDPNNPKWGEQSISRPFRYVSKRTLDSIRDAARNMSYVDAAEYVASNKEMGVLSSNEIIKYVELVRRFSSTDSPSDVLKAVVNDTGYIQYVQREEGSDTPETSRASNIGELISSATRHKDITTYIEFVDNQIKLRKRNQRKKDDNRVQIMTCHKSKGMEFSVVFIIGANEGVLPHVKSDLEEERRLFYVAMTRAKNDLYVSALSNFSNGVSLVISRFAYESNIVPHDEEDLTDLVDLDNIESSSEGNNEDSKNI